MGIKIKQIDGLQAAIDGAGGGSTPYYPTAFNYTGATSTVSGSIYTTTVALTNFLGPITIAGLSLGVPNHAGVQVFVNGVLAEVLSINQASGNVVFMTDYPVEIDDFIQLVVLWDGIESV